MKRRPRGIWRGQVVVFVPVPDVVVIAMIVVIMAFVRAGVVGGS